MTFRFGWESLDGSPEQPEDEQRFANERNAPMVNA
jgi:hypothetical protein